MRVSPGAIETEVLWIDRFGNVQLAARPSHLTEAGLGTALEVIVGEKKIRTRLADPSRSVKAWR